MMQGTYRSIGDPNAATVTLGGMAAMALLLLGFYLPTSIGADFSKILYGLAFLSSLSISAGLMTQRRNVASLPECLYASLILPILILFTGTSELHGSAYGSLILYGTLSVMLMVNFREVRLPWWSEPVLTAVNLTNFAVGVAILLGIQSVDQRIIDYYTTSKDYADLVPGMLLMRKPVLSFGTHSLAGFFFYLFFYINWEAYLALRKKKFLVFAMGYLLLTASLLSVTGVVLASIGLSQVLVHFWTVTRLKWLWGLGALSLATLGFAFPPSHASLTNMNDGAQLLRTVLFTSGGGVGGRLAPGGTLYYNIQYIRAHPFAPVGVSNSPALLFVDSGWVEYMLRGSVLLILVIYGSLYLFLKRSLVSRKDRFWLFGIILAFELGFTSLTYQRVYFLLPFAIIFLNGVRRAQENGPPQINPHPA